MEFIEKKDNIERIYSVSFDKEKLIQLLDEIVKKTSTRSKGAFILPPSARCSNGKIYGADLPNGDPMFENISNRELEHHYGLRYYNADEVAIVVHGTKVFSPKLAFIINDILLEKPNSINELLNYDSSIEIEGLVNLNSKIKEVDEEIDKISNFNYNEKLSKLDILKQLIEKRKSTDFNVELLERYHIQAKSLVELKLVSEDENSKIHPTVVKPSEEEIIKGIEEGMSISDESGLELAQRTSEHIQSKFGITKESFHQSYIDNNGFNTTMNNSCDIDSAIEEFVEKGPVKKLTKKDNINIIK